MEKENNRFLFTAGMASLIIAILHAVMIYVGPEAYRFFEAGEDMVRMANEGSWIPPAVTTGLIGIFTIFALYAFSGGRILKPLPFLRPILFLIGLIFTLRGLAVFYFLYMLIASTEPEMLKNLVFSLVSLLVGLLYLTGWSILIRD